MTNGWAWAKLTQEQLGMVEEAEQTLGENVGYILAYQQDSDHPGRRPNLPENLQVAPLNDSQMECLQGLESKLQLVMVAYQ